MILIFFSNSKNTNDLVLPGVFDVLAIFDLVIELISEDFPTLERPRKQIQANFLRANFLIQKLPLETSSSHS